MELKDLTKDIIYKRLNEVVEVFDNPNTDEGLFVNDRYSVDMAQIEELKKWYVGDSNELLEFYTEQIVKGFYSEPIYNRNRKNYFWALSAEENEIKRVHSGMAHAIITTIVRIVGDSKITCEDEAIQTRIEDIIEQNDLETLITQEQMPLTLVEGYGAYKIDYDPLLMDVPIIKFYEAKDVEFIYKQGVLLGIVYKTYYEYNKESFLLLEIRSRDKHDSRIEYELYRLGKNNNQVTKVNLDTVPEFADLKTIKFKGLPMIMGMPSIFYKSSKKKGYGRSIIDNKIDLFDELDQSLSQQGRTIRLSTPAEYVPIDLMDVIDGVPQFPQHYDRQYIAFNGTKDGDGVRKGEIQVTQPDLNVSQYTEAEQALLNNILTGVLSPATLGIDVAKKDNADAQREKEKITIFTRNEIIHCQEKIIKKILNLALYMQDFMDSGKTKVIEQDISVTYNEFANPSLESMLPTLSVAWVQGALSTERYVELLYRDKLTDEEKQHEIEELEKFRNKDDLGIEGLEDEGRTVEDNNGEEESEESAPKTKK